MGKVHTHLPLCICHVHLHVRQGGIHDCGGLPQTHNDVIGRRNLARPIRMQLFRSRDHTVIANLEKQAKMAAAILGLTLKV